MAGVALEVGDVEPAGTQDLGRPAAEVDLDDRVAAAVVDQHGQPLPPLELRLPPIDRRKEAAHREDRRRRGPTLPSATA